jgi:hypothetical protein
MEQTFRHGDVLIMRVDKLPKDSAPAKRDKGRIILAYGEVTNHSHAISEKTAKGFLSGNDLYLDLESRAEIKHEEHATIVLGPGTYRVIHQVEYRRKEIVRTAD